MNNGQMGGQMLTPSGLSIINYSFFILHCIYRAHEGSSA
jgi:hypothetical protein